MRLMNYIGQRDQLSDGLTFMYFVEDELSDRPSTSYNFAFNDSVVQIVT